jgi:ribosomal-protein-alanine N-acetyltransferase
MNHKGTVALETERLLLRRFEVADAQNAYQNWLSDPDVAMYMRWDAHSDIKQTEEFLRSLISDYEKPDFYRWAITMRPSSEVVGAIGFYVEDESKPSMPSRTPPPERS